MIWQLTVHADAVYYCPKKIWAKAEVIILKRIKYYLVMLKRMERVNSCPKTPINWHFLILNITWNSKTIKVTNNIESKKFLVSFLTPPKVTRGRLPRIQLSFSSQEAHQN